MKKRRVVLGIGYPDAQVEISGEHGGMYPAAYALMDSRVSGVGIETILAKLPRGRKVRLVAEFL